MLRYKMNEAISSETLATNEPAEPGEVSAGAGVVDDDSTSSDAFTITASKAFKVKLFVMTIALQKREICQFDSLDIRKWFFHLPSIVGCLRTSHSYFNVHWESNAQVVDVDSVLVASKVNKNDERFALECSLESEDFTVESVRLERSLHKDFVGSELRQLLIKFVKRFRCCFLKGQVECLIIWVNLNPRLGPSGFFESSKSAAVPLEEKYYKINIRS